MDELTLKQRILKVATQREFLLSLLERPNLGILKIDVNQALEELDDLLEDFNRTFPESEINY